MPRLKMLRGPSPGIEFDLKAKSVTIGRGRKNDIIIQDNEVSRNHCRLVQVLDDYEIHDLGSTNGTFVNGQQIEEGGWLLSGRSILELGDSITLEYQPTENVTGTLPPLANVLGKTKERTYYLVIEQKSQEKPEIYVLDRATITIGRDPDNDISLDEPEVSRHHMRLVVKGDGYTIEDLNTMNGTMLNREIVRTKKRLHQNDMIGIGTSVHMWFTDDPDNLLASLSDGTDTNTTVADALDDDEDPTVDRVKLDAKIQIGHGLDHGDLEKSVFLMFARDEWTTIGRHIYTYLEDNNIKTHTQQYLTPQTDDWKSAWEQALAESPCLLAIMSEKSIEDDTFIRTVRHFLAREKPMLLLRYGRVDKLPMIVRNLPAIRFDPKNPDKTYRMILAELRRIGL